MGSICRKSKEVKTKRTSFFDSFVHQITTVQSRQHVQSINLFYSTLHYISTNPIKVNPYKHYSNFSQVISSKDISYKKKMIENFVTFVSE